MTYRIQLGKSVIINCKHCGCVILRRMKMRLNSNRIYKAVYRCWSCKKYTTDKSTFYMRKRDVEEAIYLNTRREFKGHAGSRMRIELYE